MKLNEQEMMSIVEKSKRLKTNFREQGTTVKQQVKEELKDNVQEEKAKLEAQAQAEKERLTKSSWMRRQIFLNT